MLDIYGINYNGVNPRPTYEELFNFVDYPVKFPDRTATFIRVSPLLTQLDGTGMVEMEELERKEKVEVYRFEMIREIAGAIGQPAQLLRALNRINLTPDTSSLADSRTDEDYQDVEDEIDSQE